MSQVILGGGVFSQGVGRNGTLLGGVLGGSGGESILNHFGLMVVEVGKRRLYLPCFLDGQVV